MTGTAASAALRQRISDVLMSDSCQRIDYRWGPYHVDGWAYTAVALSLIGAHHSLHLTVAHMPPNTGAEYDPDTNAIKLPRANFAAATINGAANPSLGWERLSLVHECTHAAVDQMRRHHHILYRSNEVLAYVGGALFNVYEGNPFAAATSGGIWAAADRIAQNIKDRPGDIIGTHADVQALETAITQSATYNFLQSRPRTMVRNSGLPL
jgi:hypothetical protein